jgi:serine/threonine protein phosphatase 1
VVHGHTVVEAPEIAGRRVAVDTGAWASGRLTAAAIRPGAPIRFLRTGA